MNHEVFHEGVIVERTVDNGDGTGTRYTYDAEGNVTSTEAVSGLPLPEPPSISPEAGFALIGTVAETLIARAAELAEVESADPAVQAIIDAFGEISAELSAALAAALG